MLRWRCDNGPQIGTVAANSLKARPKVIERLRMHEPLDCFTARVSRSLR